MSGNKIGGLKAAQKNLATDPNFYRRIGSKGGKNGRTGGFYGDPERARLLGAMGGTVSRRGPAKLYPGEIKVAQTYGNTPIPITITPKRSRLDKLLRRNHG